MVTVEQVAAKSRWWIALVAVVSFPFLVLTALAMAILWLPGLLLLHLIVWSSWLPKGKRGIFVYSNSPNWQRDVEETVLPRLSDRMELLNWSDRKRWPNTLPVWCYRFVNFGHQREINPMAIVFRPLRPCKTVRFFEAYRDAKHGNALELERKKKLLFELIG